MWYSKNAKSPKSKSTIGRPSHAASLWGGDRIGETVKATDLEDKLGEHIGETVLGDTPR